MVHLYRQTDGRTDGRTHTHTHTHTQTHTHKHTQTHTNTHTIPCIRNNDNSIIGARMVPTAYQYDR